MVQGGCQNVTSLPNITLLLAGTPYVLTPEQYVLQVRASSQKSLHLVTHLISSVSKSASAPVS